MSNLLTDHGSYRVQIGVYLQEPARLHGPQEDLEGVLGSCAHQLSTDIYSQGGELRRPRRREGPEVPVPARTEKGHMDLTACRAARSVARHALFGDSPVQVERSDRPVQGRADDDEAAGGEGDAGDAAGVLGEGDEAEAAGGVPHFDLRDKGRHAGTQSRHTAATCDLMRVWTHLAVVAPRGDVLSVRRIRQRGHVVEVSLLLEDVRLALPLPDQQLTRP